jgi:hypothetical protein
MRSVKFENNSLTPALFKMPDSREQAAAPDHMEHFGIRRANLETLTFKIAGAPPDSRDSLL